MPQGADVVNGDPGGLTPGGHDLVEQPRAEQWRALSILADNRRHTMTELAEGALLPAPPLTKLVDRMAAANLVHRRVDEDGSSLSSARTRKNSGSC